MAVVVSHTASDFETLARRAVRQAKLADVVELRLDEAGDPGAERLAALIRELDKPVIVTAHPREVGGGFQGDVESSLELLRGAARAGAMFVDVDWRLSLALGEVEGKCHRMVSRHDFEGTPADLEAFDEDVRAVLHEGDAVKLVTLARSSEDGLRMLRHLRSARGGLVAFCMGEVGSFTRLVAPVFGSPFTYAAPAAQPGDEPPPTAPGQLRVNDMRAAWPPGGPSPETALFAIAGRGARWSFSPHVHGMALKGARLDALYVALEPEGPEGLAGVVALLDDENWRGLSVTAPFKEQACALAHTRDEDATAAGAANTLVRDPDGWRAFNTDVGAVRETLERAWRVHVARSGRAQVAREGLDGLHVLVLGAGGAARAVALAARGSGARVTLAARDIDRGRAAGAALGCEVVAFDAVAGTDHDVLVNATPVGSLAGGPGCAGASPVPAESIRAGTLVLDAVYRPLRTPFLQAAIERGATPVPGAEWFVRQAAAQFKWFTNTEPREDLLRAAFDNALREEGER